MTSKKMFLLASGLAALVAFAAPAAASAHLQWYTDPGDVLLEGEEELHVVGNLSTSVPGTGLEIKSCPVTFRGTASNSGPGGAAHGVLTSGSFSGPCETNLSAFGCNAESVSFNFGANGWTLTTETPDHVKIDNLTFTNHYTAPCQAFGIPPAVSTAGSVEGTLTEEPNANGEDCIFFEEAGGIAVETEEGPGPAVTLDGEVCITQPLTLH